MLLPDKNAGPITKLYAVLGKDKEGNEGIASLTMMDGTHIPIVFSKMNLIDEIMPLMKLQAKKFGVTTVLAEFERKSTT